MRAATAVLALFALALSGCPGEERAQASPERPASNTCVVTGCSGQVCADREVVTTCEWRPEYACYRMATCERQPTGQCGWTQTPELRRCLANPPGN